MLRNVNRYGVYAVIPNKDQDQIILVQAPNGAWFSPMGEIEAGEDHLQALKRELIEELGFTAILGRYYGQADEYFILATGIPTTTILPIFMKSSTTQKLKTTGRFLTISLGSQ